MSLELALHYAERGWPVFPLVAGDKVPAISREEGGRGCLDATTDSAQIEAWWTARPRSNVAIATGAPSGLLVVDVDVAKHPDEWRKSLAALELPRTFLVRTWSGGFHFYFAAPMRTGITIGAGLLPGIDWRCGGGYVVAAGSIVRGATYTIVRSDPIAPAPASLVDRLLHARRVRVIDRNADGRMVIPASTRNTRLAAIAGGLRRFGVEELAILESLRAINAEHCIPALDDEELVSIATSIGRYEPAVQR